jgi:hypothetical protein
MKKNKLSFLISSLLFVTIYSNASFAEEIDSNKASETYQTVTIETEKEREIATPSAGYKGADRTPRLTEEFMK